MRNSGSARTSDTSRSDCSSTVSTARNKGASTIASRISDIAMTASQRRPPNTACSFSNSGQVAATMVTAQIPGPRKGLTTHTVPSSNPPMARMDIRMRGRFVSGVTVAGQT